MLFAMLAFPRFLSGAGDEVAGPPFPDAVDGRTSLDAASLLRTLTASLAAFSAFVALLLLSPTAAPVSLAPLLRIFLSALSFASSLDSPRPCLPPLFCGLSLFAFFSLRASIRGVVL